jgi:hypothetical protein
METILAVIFSLVFAGVMVYFVSKYGGDVDESN